MKQNKGEIIMEISIGYSIWTYSPSNGTTTVENHSDRINSDDISELNLLYDYSDDCVWVTVKMKDGSEFFGKESYHRENNIKDWEALPHTSNHTNGESVW